MSERKTIVEQLLSGEELALSAIDDAIGEWHDGDSALPLHEWLGFTEDEYKTFVEKPSLIRAILARRAYGAAMPSAAPGRAIGARAATPEETRELTEWLRRTGRLSDSA